MTRRRRRSTLLIRCMQILGVFAILVLTGWGIAHAAMAVGIHR